MLCNWEMCYAIVGNKKYELNNPGIIVTKNGVIVYNHALWVRAKQNRGKDSDTPFSLKNKIIQPNHAYCLLVSCPTIFLRSNLVGGGDPLYRGGGGGGRLIWCFTPIFWQNVCIMHELEAPKKFEFYFLVLPPPPWLRELSQLARIELRMNSWDSNTIRG